MKTTKKLTGRDFDALTPAQKKAYVEKLENTPLEQILAESRPPTAAEVEHGKRLARRMRGRPKFGKGTRNISISVELDLLKRADALAKSAGVKRSEIFCLALRGMIERKAS